MSSGSERHDEFYREQLERERELRERHGPPPAPVRTADDLDDDWQSTVETLEDKMRAAEVEVELERLRAAARRQLEALDHPDVDGGNVYEAAAALRALVDG